VLATNVACRGVSLAAFADQLPRLAGQYLPNSQPVVDDTGLAGLWNFDLKWTPIAMLRAAGDDGISMSRALAANGLTLEPRTVTVPALVVDSVAEQPTPDAPDLDTRLPPLPTPAFDVASVKVSPPDATSIRAQFLPNGDLTVSGYPLFNLIGTAWHVAGPAFLVGPDWLHSKRFDVVAHAARESVATAQVDTETLRVMLQPLLIDRFQIKFHVEDREMPAQRLTANKPRMTKSDPATRTRCVREAAATSDSGVAQLATRFTCTNVTMAQFGQLLPNFASDYVSLPVADATGLEGGWDFVLSFAPASVIRAARAPGAGAAVAADLTTALTLGEAIDRQLGLRLQEEKRPAPVMVIDSALETPTEN
jgi:uncharacterized protein (TIGR03435 family)